MSKNSCIPAPKKLIKSSLESSESGSSTLYQTALDYTPSSGPSSKESVADSSNTCFTTALTTASTKLHSTNSLASSNSSSTTKMDPKLNHDKNLEILADIINEAGSKSTMKYTAPDGSKITKKTFHKTQNLTAEFIQQVIVILMTHFGFLDKAESKDGKLEVREKECPPRSDNSKEQPQMLNVTVDYLDAKILQVFFPKSMEKVINQQNYYDYMILVCPELDAKKVRSALSYFTYFCITVAGLMNQGTFSPLRALEETILSVSNTSGLINNIQRLQEDIQELEGSQSNSNSPINNSSGSGSGSYFTILPGSTVHSLPSPSSSSSSASTSLFETF